MYTPLAQRATLAGLTVLVVLFPSIGSALATPTGQADSDIVVQITSPRPGERVQGTIDITGYAADRRSTNGSGLNEQDIQVYLSDTAGQQTLLGYAGGQRPTPDGAVLRGNQFDQVGFERVWDTCSVTPGSYEIMVWVSSLVTPGARNLNRVDVDVAPCLAVPPAPAPGPASAPPPVAGPAPASTQPPPPAAPVAVPTPGRVLMRDDFSDPSSGWPNPWDDPLYGHGGYVRGEYSVTRSATASTRSAYIIYQRGSFGNFQLEVTARLVSASSEGLVAVAFRITQPGSDYAFMIEPSTGRFALTRESGGNQISLLGPTMSSAIRRGGEPNRLGIQAKGSEMVVSVNGQEVGRARDDTFSSGAIGLGAGSDANQEVEGRFSDLVVTSIE